MKALRTFDHYLRKLEYFLAIVAGIISILLMTLVTVDVILRNVLNMSIPGTFELVQLSFIGVVFLAIPYVQAIKGHINIDIATRGLPKSFQRGLDVMGCLIGLVVIVFITWQTGLEAWTSFVSGDYTMGIVQIPLWPSKLSIVLGMFFLSIRLSLDTLLYLFKLVEDSSEDSTDTPAV